MSQIDRRRRLGELELAITDIFPSPKAPAVGVTDEGSVVYLQISWVVESHADTTLDSRCACTVSFTGTQIDQYAAMNTAKRLQVQQRLKALIRTRFAEGTADGSRQGDCAVEFAAENNLFDVSDDPAQ